MRKLASVAVATVLLAALAGAQLPPAPKPPLPPPRHVGNPKLLKKVPPAYPAEAKAKRIQGKVVLRVEIGKTGTPDFIEVLSGDPLLAQAAIDAVKQWRYEPVRVGSEPVVASARVTVNFVLPREKKKPAGPKI